MIKQTLKPRVAKLSVLAIGLLCLVALCQTSAYADTVTITGSSDTQNPLTSSFSGQVGFIGQPFSHNFIVTATGQTFDFVFGQYSVAPGVALVESGCLDSPCLPITLTGNLTSPVGSLSFSGLYDEAEAAGSRFILVGWSSGSGPFGFTTPEGGSGTFTIALLDVFENNQTASTQLYNQTARVTITSFTPGGSTPVPEPTTMLLLGSGVAGLVISKRRRRREVA